MRECKVSEVVRLGVIIVMRVVGLEREGMVSILVDKGVVDKIV
jgi:hypothetical protein